jgi:hypothetical protein
MMEANETEALEEIRTIRRLLGETRRRAARGGWLYHVLFGAGGTLIALSDWLLILTGRVNHPFIPAVVYWLVFSPLVMVADRYGARQGITSPAGRAIGTTWMAIGNAIYASAIAAWIGNVPGQFEAAVIAFLVGAALLITGFLIEVAWLYNVFAASWFLAGFLMMFVPGQIDLIHAALFFVSFLVPGYLTKHYSEIPELGDATESPV